MRFFLALCTFKFTFYTVSLKYESRVKIYVTDPLLSEVDYNDKVLDSKEGLGSVLHCAISCRNNENCLSYSYNTLNKTCTTYTVIFCDRSQAKGGFSKNNNYYIAGKEDDKTLWLFLVCKKASASSTAWGGTPHRAIDGIWDPNWAGNSCQHSAYENRPWWAVDLESKHMIFTIKMLNRAFGIDRTSNVKLYVGDTLATVVQCGHFPGTMKAGSNATIDCQPPTQGQFVKILMDKTQVLQICEVGVYGHPIM